MKPNVTILYAKIMAGMIFLFSPLITPAQCIAPAMTWSNPTLVSGVALQKDAVYKFPSVTAGVNAFVTVKDLKNGATLTSIDNTVYGYSAAWQPVVKTPAVQGAGECWVEFKIEFKDSVDGRKHKYNCFQLSFIDVDGDNQRVREFVAAYKPDLFLVSNISILSISTVNDMVKAMGRVGNYPNLDTTSYVTNINYRYYNADQIENVWIGNKTDSAFAVQDRYTCGYFKPISMPLQFILPVTYVSFTGTVAGNNHVNLNWITANEIHNSHFEVERSFGSGDNFKRIVSITESDYTKDGQRNYQYKDESNELAGQKVVFYRLKQVDVDGKFTYSEVLAVKLSSKNDGTLTVFPNPFADKLELKFSVKVDALAEVRIISLSGKVILINRSKVNKGPVHVKVGGLQQLQPGAYIAQLVINGNVVEYQKVIKN